MSDALVEARVRGLCKLLGWEISDEDVRNIVEAERQKLIRKLGFINLPDLARRLRDSGPLLKHERDFLADLVEGKKYPRHRRQSVGIAVRNDAIVEEYLWFEASDPDRQKGLVEYDIAKRFGVSTGYVRKLVRAMSPRRRKQIEDDMREHGPLHENEQKLRELKPK
jgi:hypothetical protein